MRIAVAVALLRHGRTPAQAAESTEVPFALVEWLAEHTSGSERQGSGITDRTQADTRADAKVDTEAGEASVSVSPAAAKAEGWAWRRTARWRVRATVPFGIGWLATCVLSVISVLFRQPMVGALTVMLSLVLAVASAIVIVAHLGGRQGPGRR